MGKEKRRRTFSDLINEDFAKEEDLIKLRNILIDRDILIIGDANTGLPLLFAIICDILREELKINPLLIYSNDEDYDYKLHRAKTKNFERVLFPQVFSDIVIEDAIEVAKRNPIIVCANMSYKMPKSLMSNFEFIIKMGYGQRTNVRGIYKMENYLKI